MKTLFGPKAKKERDYEFFFDSNELPRIQYLIETKQFLGLSRLQQNEQDDNGVKVKLSLTERGKRAAVQIFEYTMSCYEAISPVMIFEDKEALALSGAVIEE